MAGLTKKEKLAIAEFAGRLRDRFPYNVDSIKLYGSKARGDASQDSDVDLLLIVKKRTPDIDEATIDIVCDILNESGVFIETVTMTTADYDRAVKLQYPYTINVERDSIAI